MANFHDMIEETMEVFMDDFSIFGDSFSSCISHLDKMLKRCEDTNLVLNWEKCHFMVKESIILGHKISKSEIKVDKAKVDVIDKLPHLTSVKGAKNLAADHLSRLENSHQDELEKKEITETFSLEALDGVFTAKKPLISSQLAIMDPPGDILMPVTPLRKALIPVFIGRLFTEMPVTWSHGVTLVNVKAKSRNVMKCLKMESKIAPDLKASRARGFILRSLELQSLAYGNPIS
nr:reverse transcriptase domain-containing protein [Tanacetum cinerariifolium]